MVVFVLNLAGIKQGYLLGPQKSVLSVKMSLKKGVYTTNGINVGLGYHIKEYF